MFEITLDEKALSSRVKSLIGIPDAFLSDSVITSPDFKLKAQKYINKQLVQIADNYNESITDELQDLVNMSGVYYIAYLLCVTMPVRLPVRMENISTKTLLQTIDWGKFADEMLGRCDDILTGVLEDEGIEMISGSTIIALSDEMSYPNTLI